MTSDSNDPIPDEHGDITITLRGRAAAQLRQLVKERRHLSPAQVVAALLQGEMDRRTNQQTHDNFWEMKTEQMNAFLDSIQPEIDAAFADLQAKIDAGMMTYDPDTNTHYWRSPDWVDDDEDDDEDDF